MSKTHFKCGLSVLAGFQLCFVYKTCLRFEHVNDKVIFKTITVITSSYYFGC